MGVLWEVVEKSWGFFGLSFAGMLLFSDILVKNPRF